MAKFTKLFFEAFLFLFERLLYSKNAAAMGFIYLFFKDCNNNSWISANPKPGAKNLL